MNIALYPRHPGWAMTERGERALDQTRDTLTIGPSRLSWIGDSLEIEVDELTFPLPSRIRGRILVRPRALVAGAFALDEQARHRWCPIATRADVEVRLTSPRLEWCGLGYLDSNFGDEPLEAGFHDWQWSRVHLAGEERVFYEGRRVNGSHFALGLAFDRTGTPAVIPLPPLAPLRRTLWGIRRVARAEAASIRRTWEDTPFYARTALAVCLEGEIAPAVHESLSLSRLRHPLVRMLLPWRMPRRP